MNQSGVTGGRTAEVSSVWNPVVDVHAHFFPRISRGEGASLGSNGPWLRDDGDGTGQMMVGGREYRPVDASLWDPDARVAGMDKHGVDVQVVSAAPLLFGYDADPAVAARRVEEGPSLRAGTTDQLAEDGQRGPGRDASSGQRGVQIVGSGTPELGGVGLVEGPADGGAEAGPEVGAERVGAWATEWRDGGVEGLERLVETSLFEQVLARDVLFRGLRRDLSQTVLG